MTQQLHILIGDDGSAFSVRLADQLRSSGFWAYTRPQKLTALRDALHQETPDAVILQMTHVGADFFQMLTSLTQEHRVPVAVILSESTPLLRRQLNLMGVSLCLTKPMFLSEMASALRCMLIPLQKPAESASLLEKSVEQTVTALIQRFGIPAHLNGYHYLRDAIVQVYLAPQLMRKVTAELYPQVASHFDTTASRVERSIRNAVEYAWEHGAKAILAEQFCTARPMIHGKPTNSEMIAMVADYLRVERYPSEKIAE